MAVQRKLIIRNTLHNPLQKDVQHERISTITILLNLSTCARNSLLDEAPMQEMNFLFKRKRSKVSVPFVTVMNTLFNLSSLSTVTHL